MIFIDDIKIADMLQGHQIMYTIIQKVFQPLRESVQREVIVA